MRSLATLDDLGRLISEHVEAYIEDVIPKLEKRLDDTADEIINYIKTSAPRSGYKNAFADSFVKAESGKDIHKTIAIFSEGKGGMTHLLEFGFTHRSGKYVGPRPFLRPAYDLFTPKMIEDIKEIIIKGD